MSFNQDGKLDLDEALRILEIASKKSDGVDLLLHVESKGTPVEGESPRRFDDGKLRMDMLGYSFGVSVHQPPGGAKGQVRAQPVIVVRQSDAATASLSSLLKSQAHDLTVSISAFKAGGDDSPDAQPTLVLELQQARVERQMLLSGGVVGVPCEIVVFDYRSVSIRSAPQQRSGIRGAVRTCTFP